MTELIDLLLHVDVYLLELVKISGARARRAQAEAPLERRSA